MKRNQLIVVIIIVFILLVGGGLFLSKHSMSPSQAGQTANSATQQSGTQKKSLFDFFSMAGSQKCTFSDQTSNSSGTVYISSGKMRGDFQSADNGKTNSSHMINDGQYVYFWSDGQNNGYKMSLTTIKQQESQVTTSPQSNSSEQTPSQGVNMKQQSNYSCGPWSEDASMFTVPTNVTFTDYSSMMQGAGTGAAAQSGAAPQGMTSQQKQQECAACNQVPAGSMRNQCLAQLHC